MTSTPYPTLPLELLLLIAEHLPTATLSSFSRTCHSLRQLLTPHLNSHFADQSTSILYWAAKRNLPATVERALTHLPRGPPKRWICTPWGLSFLLVCAIRDRHTELVKVLLAHGIDPNRPIGTYIPLISAVKARDTVIARILLEAGADPDKTRRDYPETARNTAESLQDKEMMDLLLEYSGAG